ncbi:cell division endopeptidase DipM [soil metagenome]
MTLSYSRTALILLAATSLGACTTYTPFGEDAQVARPSYPTRLPAPGDQTLPPAQDAQDQAPVPQAGPYTGPVESRPLEPLPGRPAYVTPSTPAYPSSPPVMQTITKDIVTGKVVDADGPAKTYKVKSGDNLDAIARTLGTTRSQLAEANSLKPPFVVRPGMTLTGPSSSAKAYVVESGDTLYAIARRFSVGGQALADSNSMGVDDALQVGRRLILPDGFQDKGPTTITTRVQVPGTGVQPSAPAPFQPQAPMPQRPPAYTPPPVAQPEPEPEAPRTTTTTTTKTFVTGKLVDVAGPPQIYTVKDGQALDAIARAMDTTRKQLADDNKLKEPYVLHKGDKLKGPKTTVKAYVAVSGDTIPLIAKRFNVTPKALAAENDMKVGDSIKSGRKISLPDGYKDKGPVKETTKTTVTLPAEPRRDTTPEPSRPYTPPVYQPVTPPPSNNTYRPVTPPPTQPSRPYTPPPTTPNAGPLTDAQIQAQGRGRFNWPLRGDIISDFGPKGTGQRNDGLNIRANAGEAVRAAAAGDVVYAGDQVPGFGNLVLIKHADGWVTAYGHLARVDVKMQQKVVQGQQIGQAGTSGGVSEPQVHFEVRFAPAPTERARPIDPKLVLGR